MTSYRARQLSVLGIYAVIVVVFIAVSALPTAIWRAYTATGDLVVAGVERDMAEKQLAQTELERTQLAGDLQKYESWRIAANEPTIHDAIAEHIAMRERLSELEADKQQLTINHNSIIHRDELRIAILKSQVIKESQRADEATRRESKLLALKDAQGWTDESCPSPRRTVAPPPQQPAGSPYSTGYPPLNCCVRQIFIVQ